MHLNITLLKKTPRGGQTANYLRQAFLVFFQTVSILLI